MIGFSGNAPNIENEKRRAKLYTQIYKYAAEDFTNYQNMYQWVAGLYAYLNRLELRIAKLTAVLNTHTHKVAPHIHPIPPHIHISTRPGDPTTPNIGAQATLVNAPVEGLLSTQMPKIIWTKGIMPPNIINTTGAITNMINKIGVIYGGALEGEELGPQRVRQIKPTILLTPSIPNYVTGGIRAIA